MQFNPGDDTGIVDEINDICQSDNNSYPLKSKARRVNSALDRFFILAHKASKPGTVDDINQTTAPIETINLSSGTGRYALDTFTSELDSYVRFEVLDADGNNILLTRLNRENVLEPLTNYRSTNGTPREYDIIGKYIELYPAPDYSVSGGLKAYFERNKSALTSADTTKSPGIPSKFHTYICRLASLPYLIEFQKGQKNDIAQLVQQDEREIELHFLTREKGVRRGLGTVNEDTR